MSMLINHTKQEKIHLKEIIKFPDYSVMKEIKDKYSWSKQDIVCFQSEDAIFFWIDEEFEEYNPHGEDSEDSDISDAEGAIDNWQKDIDDSKTSQNEYGASLEDITHYHLKQKETIDWKKYEKYIKIDTKNYKIID